MTVVQTQRGSGVYVEIAPTAGVDRQTVQPEGGLDVGDTGLLGTTAWQKAVDQGPSDRSRQG
ncbi:hypothetical protein OHS70_36185 [Streptomyces sp. NBC_00390]|uniref:hypothetical protein n=1 Tax=Streptomyces sp. NBC_00390 TaxID=2975736 RepID=UPI002E228B59